jgi:hypothetical protein
MTDTTNHAEVIRAFIDGAMDPDYHESVASCPFCLDRRTAALAALDALTREVAMLCDARDNWKGRHDILDREGFKVSRELDAARATIAAQSERIKALEAFIADLDCECTPPVRLVDGEMTEKWICPRCAALAPKEAQGASPITIGPPVSMTFIPADGSEPVHLIPPSAPVNAPLKLT